MKPRPQSDVGEEAAGLSKQGLLPERPPRWEPREGWLSVWDHRPPSCRVLRACLAPPEDTTEAILETASQLPPRLSLVQVTLICFIFLNQLSPYDATRMMSAWPRGCAEVFDEGSPPQVGDGDESL